ERCSNGSFAMQRTTFGLFAFALSATVGLVEVDALACGACMGPPSSSTQVSGHRMILSVSQQATTLWDQLEYAGDASEFAWVLPIHGQVDVGLSSDVLFGQLDALTDPRVVGYGCPSTNCSFSSTYAATGSSMTTTGSGVTVITQEVVGPYETVQLAST